MRHSGKSDCCLHENEAGSKLKLLRSDTNRQGIGFSFLDKVDDDGAFPTSLV